MPSITITLAILTSILTPITTATTTLSACPPQSISVRLPPDLDPAANQSTFLSPPTNFWTGTWYQTNSSIPSYRTYSNLQWDVWPQLASCTSNTSNTTSPCTPPGTLLDLTTWVLNSSSAPGAVRNYGALGGDGTRPVSSFLGFDTPRRVTDPSAGPGFDGVFDLVEADGEGGVNGNGFRDTWSVLYWGEDRLGVPWALIHESTPQSLQVVTRSEFGVREADLEEVLGRVVELASEEVSGFVRELGMVRWDYGLRGGAVVCGLGCRENRDV